MTIIIMCVCECCTFLEHLVHVDSIFIVNLQLKISPEESCRMSVSQLT